MTLRDDRVTLEPITERHVSDLTNAVDEHTFEYMPMRSRITNEREMRRYIGFQNSRPDTIALVVIDNDTRRAIGSSSFMNIRPEHRGLEIGSTWIGPDHRGTGVNASMKLLMLTHAFDSGAIRVELKTDSRNARSRRAIEKLGATPEGIARNHMIMPDRAIRHSAIYSITIEDWPDIEQRLRARITR